MCSLTSLMLILTVFCPFLQAADASLTPDDVLRIKQVHEKYRQAWLAGDAQGVRNVFVEDSVLLPHHGDPPRVGREQLDKFWFPAGAAPAKVVRLELTYNEIGGAGAVAYVWGTHSVSWVAAKDGKSVTFSNSGTYLNVLRKLPNGEWRISHHMWDDPEPADNGIH